MKEIPLFKVAMSPTAGDAVSKVLGSGYVGQGEKVEEFEANLRSFFNHDYVVTLNSATSGLTLAIRMAKDRFKEVHGYDGEIEVLTTPLTCTATNWPILANDLGIKWVDVDKETLNMDLDDLERKLSPTTRIIVVVHWGGYPVDLDRLEKIRRKAREMYGYFPEIIQDCAHAFGSTLNGYQVGAYPRLGNSSSVYSFQAIKHLTSVDGGAILTPMYFYQEAKLLRWYGIDRESNTKDFRCEADVEKWGYKFHMNDVNATIGIENLKEVDWFVDRHKDNGKYYNRELAGIDGVTLLKDEPGFDSAYWIYSLKVENQEGFMKAMADRGIAVSRVHERNDKHTAVKDFVSPLPSLDEVIKEMICIPSGWWVTNEDREYIVKSIKQGW